MSLIRSVFGVVAKIAFGLSVLVVGVFAIAWPFAIWDEEEAALTPGQVDHIVATGDPFITLPPMHREGAVLLAVALIIVVAGVRHLYMEFFGAKWRGG